MSATKAQREVIVAHSDAYRAAYAAAYRILRSVDALSAERRAIAHAAMDFGKLTRRMDGVLRRELRGGGSARGRIDRAFLGGLTHQGELCRFDTVEALCPRAYVLMDSYGLAARELSRVADHAAAAGYDVLLCPNPDRPKEAMHVLIPGAGVAFVTATARMPCPGEAYRNLRVEAMAELSRSEKAKLRFTGRIEQMLRDEAAAALRCAKSEHDALEAAYNPCVDFDGVYTLAAEEAKRLLTYQK